MRTTTRHAIFQPSVLALAIALGCVAPVQAVTFTLGEVEAQFDSQLSVGASWSVRGADPDFVSVASGGKASSRTSDDGRLNFKKGETFSKIFKGIHDLELKYGDTGVFIRGKYWYDFETKDESRLFYDIDDHNRKEAAQSSGAQILDAFIYHNYNLGDKPGSVRVGKQVVSWGESTFIGNSVNSINPIDVAAFRRPGAEIKEGLIPVSMFYVQQSLTDTLAVEAFYQLEWEKFALDNCGTFFAGDTSAKGCDRNVVGGTDLDPRRAAGYRYLPRADDDEARDGGQWGVAMRWVAEELNSTEFGLYAMNYHSRTPFYSTKVAYTATAALDATGAVGAEYFFEYPEDIRLYGLSFQSNIDGTSVGGEISHRPNMPLQINTVDMTLAALYPPALVPALQNPVYSTGHAQAGAPKGSEIHGYERKPYTQAQVTVVHLIDQVMGASRVSLLGEVGFGHISSISEGAGDELRFGRDSVYGLGQLEGSIAPGVTFNNAVCKGQFNTANPQQCNDDGFFTANSWGYRLRASADYTNVFAGINLTPSIAWSHDVDGYGPSFIEGSKAVSLGLNADYESTYTASLSYTDFFGGDYNTSIDRDFVALSFGMSF